MIVKITNNTPVVSTTKAITIVKVEKGVIGPQGIPGQGFPSGGTTGQVLAKIDATNYNTVWSDAGSGDMTKAIYDPTNVFADAFDMDNMVESATSKILTATERTNLTTHLSAANPHSASAASGANSDITSLSGITGNISSVNVLNFKVASTNVAPVEGDAWWNPTDHTLNLKTNFDPILQVGQEMYVYGKNNTGSTILNGKLVMSTTSQGDRPEFTLAKADAEITSQGTLAMATHNIADAAEGITTCLGFVRGIKTDEDSDGNSTTGLYKIYLSPFTLGGWTVIKPTSSHHTVRLGQIIRNHISGGILFIKIDNGYEMEELHNVSDTPPSVTGQIQAWNNSTGRYELTVSPTFVDMTFTDPQGDPFTVRDLSAHQLDAFNELATTEFDLTCATSLGVRTITATQPESEKLEFIISEKKIEQPVQQVMTQVHTGLEGTDTAPNTIYTYFKNDGTDEPELFATNADPNGSTAHVDGIYEVVGSIAGSIANVYATNNGKAYINEKLEAMIDRAKEEGNIYKSGIDITADANSFATATGVARHVLANVTIPALELNRLVAVDTQFTIEDDSTYTTYDDFQIDEYYDGIAVGNNHHVKCRIVAVINNPELTSARYHIIPQAGTSVYATPSQAWADLSKMIRTTPRDTIVKYASVHIADIVIKNTGGTFTLVANPDTGLFYNDVRSESGGAGGGGAASQNLYETITGNSGTSTAPSSTASLAIVGGIGMNTAVTADTATINYTLKGSFGARIGDDGTAIVAGKKSGRIITKHAGTISRIEAFSEIAGVKTAKTIKIQILVNDSNISATDPIYLNAASEEVKTSFTSWTLGFSARDEITWEVLGSPTPDAEVVTINVEYDITG